MVSRSRVCFRVGAFLSIAASLAAAARAEGLAGQAVVRVELADATGLAAERWSEPKEEGSRGYRLCRSGMNAYVPVPKFWKVGQSPQGLWLLRVRYKDVATEPAVIRIYNGRGGQWGNHFAGTLAGKADKRWKVAEIVVPGWMFGVVAGSKPPHTQVMLKSGAGDLPVATIEVCRIPAERQRLARLKYFQARERSRWALAAKMPEVSHLEPASLEPIAEDHRRLGFVPFVRSYIQAVYPNTIPTQAERHNRLAAYVTPGEAEPILFGIRSLDKPLEDVQVRVGPLQGDAGTLPAGAVRVGVVEFAPIRWGGGSAVKKWQVRQTRIWPIEKFPGNRYFKVAADGTRTIPAETTAAFWLTIQPKPDAAAGLYHSDVIFAANGQQYRFDLQVRILPFRLVQNRRWWIGMYISSQLTDRQIADLAEHGVNATSQWPNGYVLKNVGGRCVVEFQGEDDYMRRLQAVGITGPHVWFQGNDRRHRLDERIAQVMRVQLDTPEFYKHYVDVVRQFHARAAEAGWNELIWSIFDEPSKGGRAQKRWLGDAKAIRKALGDRVKLFGVMMNRGPRKAREFLPYVDIWSCNGKIEQMVAFASQHGGEVWSYGGCSHRVDPGTARWSYGFNVWRSGVKGHYAWAYNWPTGDDPLNDLDGSHMDWFVSFPDTDGRMIPSPAWEALREGTDDLRYLLTAMQRLEAKPDHPKAAWARRQLQKIKARLTGTEAAPDKTGIDVLGQEFVPTDDSAMAWARNRLVQIILALGE